MDFNAIQNLIKEISQSDLTLLDIEGEGIHIRMQKGNVQSVEKPTSQLSIDIPTPVTENIVRENVTKEPIEKLVVENKNCKEIVSPIVGTFYEALGPDKPPFVKVGDKVKKGQTLCIIEAMKLMNEIESDYDGEIIEILIKNEQPVEYGQPLFKIS